MKPDLNLLEIRILLKCSQETLNRTDVSQVYYKYSKEERYNAIRTLIKRDLIQTLELPKLDTKRVPIFYEITNKGKQWVKQYVENYPK